MTNVKIKNTNLPILFKEMKEGDFFIYHSRLYLKEKESYAWCFEDKVLVYFHELETGNKINEVEIIIKS